jgi:hypothetical protein
MRQADVFPSMGTTPNFLTADPARPKLRWVSDETTDPIVIRVVGRLAARYPEAPRSHIEDIVGEEYDTLDSGIFQAERYQRELGG